MRPAGNWMMTWHKENPLIESAPAADKKKGAGDLSAQLDKTYGKGTVMRLGENTGVVVDSIPTGFPSLDIAWERRACPMGPDH